MTVVVLRFTQDGSQALRVKSVFATRLAKAGGKIRSDLAKQGHRLGIDRNPRMCSRQNGQKNEVDMGYALEGCFPKQSVSSLTLHGALAAGQYTYTYTPRAESPPKEGPHRICNERLPQTQRGAASHAQRTRSRCQSNGPSRSGHSMGGETNKATGRDTRSIVDQCFLCLALLSLPFRLHLIPGGICAGWAQSRCCCCDDDHRVRASS